MENSPESKAWEYVIRVPEIEPDYDHAALLIIDLQYATASRDHGMFRKLREAGIGEASEYAMQRIETLVVPTVGRLAAAFRAASRPVIYARCASIRGDGSDQTARHRAQGLVYPVDSKEAQILDELEPQQGDIVLTKTGSGAFTSTNLDHLLGNQGANTLVVTGMWTNSCVETTVRHAGDLDYRVVVVEDACVAMTRENHANALAYLDNNFCTVKLADVVLDELGDVAYTNGGAVAAPVVPDSVR
jgi:nicotinamidase-related amidase